jgi:hypothetical protein
MLGLILINEWLFAPQLNIILFPSPLGESAQRADKWRGRQEVRLSSEFSTEYI